VSRLHFSKCNHDTDSCFYCKTFLGFFGFIVVSTQLDEKTSKYRLFSSSYSNSAAVADLPSHARFRWTAGPFENFEVSAKKVGGRHSAKPILPGSPGGSPSIDNKALVDPTSSMLQRDW
jgi:hypothetical protein